jgi:CheY-like chemotaxis protein
MKSYQPLPIPVRTSSHYYFYRETCIESKPATVATSAGIQMKNNDATWTRWRSLPGFLGGKGMPVRILIADDDVSIRFLLRRILEERPGWEVCGEAANGNDAVAKIKQLEPDLAIIDLAMPDKNGIEAARQICAMSPLTTMLLLTVQEVSAELARAAREAGFRGAVTKGSGREVVMAVETLLDKGTLFQVEGSSERA